MYKVSIQTLLALKDALEKSNRVLRESLVTSDSLSIRSAIRSNEEQLKVLEQNFYLNDYKR